MENSLKTVAYIRVSTDKQACDNQKLEILEYARLRGITIDDFIEITMSSKKSSKDRRIDEILAQLNGYNCLVVTEFSRLGRSTAEVITLINKLIEHKFRIIVCKQNFDISKSDMNSKIIVTLFALFSELERDIISSRTKEALAAKRSQGVVLGKPRGTIQKSKFDADLPKIKELLAYGLSVRKTAKVLGYPNPIGLNSYLHKRKLK